MSTKKSSGGFALSLVVGVDDLFTKKAEGIKKESKKLEKNIKGLQKTVDDTSAYRAAEKALNALSSSEKKNTKAIKTQEKELLRLGRSLKGAGVDVSNITNEQKRLQKEIKQTNKGMKKQISTAKKMSGIKRVAAGAVVGAGIFLAGNSTIKNEKQLAASTDYTPEQTSSKSQRAWRANMVNKLGASTEDVFEALRSAKQQNLGSEEDTRTLASSTLEYKSIFPTTDVIEFSKAAANYSKSFGVGIKEASEAMFAIAKSVGDGGGELFDNITEYSPLLGNKLTSDQLVASLIAAKKAGARDFDVVLDSFKETFQAKMSDANEVAKLLGTGNKPGDADKINNLDLRKEMKSAVYLVRENVKQGKPLGKSYASLMQVMQKVKAIQPGISKTLMEDIGGTRFAEDVGDDGTTAITDALFNPGKYFQKQNLEKTALSTQTNAESIFNDFKVAQGSINTSMYSVIENFNALATATDFVSTGFTNVTQEHSSVGVAVGLGQLIGIGGAGWIAKKLMPKYMKGIIGSLFKGAGGLLSKAIPGKGMMGSLLKGFGGIFSKASPIKEATNLASKIPNVSSLLGKGASILPTFAKGAMRKLPLIGTALNLGTASVNLAEGDYRNLAGDVGAIIGGLFGGAGGSLVMPGVGTAVGGVVGSVAGEQAAQWLYDVFNGNDDVVQTQNQITTLQTTPGQIGATATVPVIEINFSPQITIESTTNDADAVAESITQALRDMTPELKQQLSNAMSDIFKSHEYLLT